MMTHTAGNQTNIQNESEKNGAAYDEEAECQLGAYR